MYVRDDATSGDRGRGHNLCKLLIVAEGELKVARSNSLLLSFLSGVACEFQDLDGEVFEDGSSKGTGSDTYLLGIAACSEHASDTADWESQTCFARVVTALTLLGGALSSWHCFSFSNY